MEFFRLRSTHWRYFNYPLYVPEGQRKVLRVLSDQGVTGLTAELERLASLGSPWAASTLGYLSLLPSSSGNRDPARAMEYCAKAAADGDAYALFVTGWARSLLTQDRVRAAELMMASRKLRFAPATIALAFLAWPSADASLKMLNDAVTLRHKAAWAFRCGFFRTGRLGIGRQILGYVLTPFVRLQYALAAWIDPFSVGVVVLTITDKRPAFRSVGD